MSHFFNRPVNGLITGSLVLLLTACGGGSSGDTGAGGSGAVPTAAPVASLSIGLKQLRFSWDTVDGSDHYRLLQNPDGSSGFTVVSGADNITTTSHDLDIALHKLDWVNAEYRVEACNAEESSCLGSSNLTLSPVDAIAATGYFKSSNTEAYDAFGHAVALSGDGNTLAVGAYPEDSAASGINGNQSDNSALTSGAVYLFVNTAGGWVQQAYIKASNTETYDWFGSSIALSDDGNTLAVGAQREESAATGINGNQLDNSASSAGAVYIYTRTAGNWSQQAYVKASNTDANDNFGIAIALSGDGDTLAAGAESEDSSATGVNGNQTDNSSYGAGSGAVYLYTRNAGQWSQQAYIKASNTDAFDSFGTALDLNDNGTTLAVNARYEDSAATGIDGNQGDNTASNSGAVYVYTLIAGDWSQQAYIKASNTGADDYFGYSIALSDDGNTLAVGASTESSSAVGVGGSQSSDTASQAGAAYVFARSATGIWSQQAYIKASNTGTGDLFGYSIALSGDAQTLAVGAHFEDSAATGINGEQTNAATNAGAVYTFTHNTSGWLQQAYVKATHSESNDLFGNSIALSTDGDTLAVGAYRESSGATGIGGDAADNTAAEAGAVYLY